MPDLKPAFFSKKCQTEISPPIIRPHHKMSKKANVPLKKYKTTGQINLEKLDRKTIQEKQRRIKPGECLKYIRASIDPEFLCGTAGSKTLEALVNAGIKYKITSQDVPRIITWERSEHQTLVTSAENIALSEKYTLEKHVIFLMLGQELVEAIKNKTLLNTIAEIRSKFTSMAVTLIVFGLKTFCRDNTHAIKRKEIEYGLTELQIVHNCSHRLHETSDEVAATILQFSKAIAEIPFKKQENEKYDEINLFLQNDNKDCVRINGNAGLGRLWQQHLTKLPLVTLETAEAIINEYPKPKLLFEAYENNSNGDDVLADLKVRRAGGPLASVRRVGPELSRKVHTLYTSLDPNEKL